MKINDYVRTKGGRIGIIQDWEFVDKEYAKENIMIKFQDELTDSLYHKSNIVKSSPNIIDLIEDKDLIKIEYKLATGQKQQEILEIIKNREEKLFVNSWIRKMFIEEFKYFDIEIKSIITKEQFESMEYKVKE